MITKSINLGKNKFFFLLLILLLQSQVSKVYAEDETYYGKIVDVKILDKLSSKNKLIKINVGEDYIFKNLSLKVLKCKNSKFDDNPEITAYIQAKDLTIKSKDEVFVFNGWMFSSSPSIAPFDHAVYDIWLVDCY